jgi:hypothetical protein
MFAVEVYAAVRHFVFVEGNSRREAARVFGLSRETVLKMCRFSLPPGYTRTKPVMKPKLGALLPVIDAIRIGQVWELPVPRNLQATSPCSPARPVWFVSCFNRPGGAGLTNASDRPTE